MPQLRPTDWILAGLIGAAGLYEIAVAPIVEPGVPGPAVLAAVTVVLLAVAVLVRRPYPLRALTGVLVAAGAQLALNDDPSQYQPSAEAFIALLLTAYSVALNAERLRAIQALVAVLALHMLAAALRPSRAAAEDGLGMLVLLALLWTAASAVRARQDRIAELEDEHAREAAAAVTAERARIARELHDIVAHAVSVMMVQIGGARHMMRSDARVAEESMQLAEAAGREALTEMRRLVGLMREDDPTVDPTPGVASLPRLADRFEKAGLPVSLDVDPAAESLPAGVDLAAYRVVQEGLTNALKHAGAVPTAVTVRRHDQRLDIEVRNGPGTSSNGEGGGHGLIGLRERVALYGGKMAAGPADGGFSLRVELPL